MLHLQRTAGNQAVQRLLGPSPAAVPETPSVQPAVQRLTITASELDREGDRRISALFPIATSEYGKIRNTLADYEAAKLKRGSEADQERLLAQLEAQCKAWLRTNTSTRPDAKKDTSATAGARRKVIKRLLRELPTEQVTLWKRRAQQRLMENFTAAEGSADPHRLKLATDASRDAARDAANFEAEFDALKRNPMADPKRFRVLKLLTDKGITPAEYSAIVAYTNSDFLYMNPATANKESWIEGAMKEPEVASKLQDVPPDEIVRKKTMREEGSLLTMMAMSGLAKMDPFEGTTYRGETTTETELATKAVKGDVSARPNLSSTAKKWETALSFANRNLKGEKDIALFWAIDHPKGISGGRDIAMLSAVESEGEVLNMVDSPFETKSVIELKVGDSPSGPHEKFIAAILKSTVMKYARKVYVANAVAVAKDAEG